ncbi:transmembrane amino acid transporter protein [Oesophagostomum dentatum]|uniref:Transmembrane amino acid transporter protein n=1 Tax=Oesophagostomum dentatum TaxID=61180 RepID=A0A0B1TGR1_OESDE|nr:transmembrane amino acid transporter protein [Oesophagostomum dentatum]
MADQIRSSYAFIVLVKALCGVGVFALPTAFKQSGLLVGMALVIALGIVDAHSMIKLVQCSQYLSKKKQLSESANKSASSTAAESPNANPHGSSKERMTGEEKTRTPTEQYAAVDQQEEPTKNPDIEHSRNEAEEDVKGDGNRRIALNYGDMAEEAFSSMSSEGLKKIGKPAKFAVDACIIGLQVGICSVYYVFVVDHTKEAIDYLFSADFSRDLLFFALLPFFVLIASVRSLTALSLIGLVGNILVTIAIIHVNLVVSGAGSASVESEAKPGQRNPVGLPSGQWNDKMFAMDHFSVSQLPAFTSFGGTALAAGSIVYAYVAQAMVLALENKMKRPQDMLGFSGVISMAVIFVAILYATTAFLGYITYGEQLKGSVTLNLTNSP